MNLNETRLLMAGMANAMSPVRLFNVQAARRMGSALAKREIPRLGTLSARAALRSAWSGNMGEAFAGQSARGMPWGDVFGSWWRGHYIEDVANPARFARLQSRSMYQSIAAANATKRRVAAGLLGAAVAGPVLLGRNNIVTRGGEAGTTLGASAGAAAWALERSYRGAGNPGLRAGAAGFAGLTVLNMLRTGDQIGPF